MDDTVQLVHAWGEDVGVTKSLIYLGSICALKWWDLTRKSLDGLAWPMLL